MSKRAIMLAAGLLASVSMAPAAHAEVKVRAINPFPPQQIFGKEFLNYIRILNQAGKGVYKVELVGGPAAIPMMQQAGALRNGIVDMLWAPASFHRGLVPEVDALSASNVTPWEARGNGGVALLDRIYGEKLKAHFLGWTIAGFGFHVFLTKPPKVTGDGGVDLRGLKLRSAPMYTNFFKKIGVINVAMRAPDIYTGLERGVIVGMGWPALAITDLGWQKFINHRIDPSFLQADGVTLVNLKKWQSLPAGARKALTDATVAYEKTAVGFWEAAVTKEQRALEAAGLKVITLKDGPAKTFVADAAAEVWKRLEATGSPHAKALREKFAK